jgi:hypothetical protein
VAVDGGVREDLLEAFFSTGLCRAITSIQKRLAAVIAFLAAVFAAIFKLV